MDLALRGSEARAGVLRYRPRWHGDWPPMLRLEKLASAHETFSQRSALASPAHHRGQAGALRPASGRAAEPRTSARQPGRRARCRPLKPWRPCRGVGGQPREGASRRAALLIRKLTMGTRAIVRRPAALAGMATGQEPVAVAAAPPQFCNPRGLFSSCMKSSDEIAKLSRAAAGEYQHLAAL